MSASVPATAPETMVASSVLRNITTSSFPPRDRKFLKARISHLRTIPGVLQDLCWDMAGNLRPCPAKDTAVPLSDFSSTGRSTFLSESLKDAHNGRPIPPELDPAV